MIRFSRVIATVVVVVLSSWQPIMAQEDYLSIASRFEKSLDEGNTKKSAALGSLLFTSMTATSQCEQLKSSKNATVALLASFKESRLAVEADSQATSVFAKFVEQTCNFEIPAIILTRLSQERGVRTDLQVPRTDLDKFNLSKEIRIFNRIWRVAQAVEVTGSSPSSVEVKCQDRVLQLTRKGVSHMNIDYENLAFAKNGDATFVAAAGDIGASLELFSFDAKGGLLWSSKVWSNQTQNQLISTGSDSSVLGVSEENDSVVVFGIRRGVFIEGFDKSNGKNLFRFSSTQWHGRHVREDFIK
jgi:hypothetical protein